MTCQRTQTNSTKHNITLHTSKCNDISDYGKWNDTPAGKNQHRRTPKPAGTLCNQTKPNSALLKLSTAVHCLASYTGTPADSAS